MPSPQSTDNAINGYGYSERRSEERRELGKKKKKKKGIANIVVIQRKLTSKAGICRQICLVVRFQDGGVVSGRPRFSWSGAKIQAEHASSLQESLPHNLQ